MKKKWIGALLALTIPAAAAAPADAQSVTVRRRPIV